MASLNNSYRKNTDEPEVRLLVCHRCHTVEELPDYEGPADEDAVLLRVVSAHQSCTPGGALVGGRTPEEALRSDRALARVERKHWNNPDTRAQILAQLGQGETGLGSEFYAVKNTLHEDALKCFSKHHRPDTCIDWKDQSKIVGNAILTDEEKKASKLLEGIRTKRQNKQVYLCDFCPVKSKVQEKVFRQRGLYK